MPEKTDESNRLIVVIPTERSAWRDLMNAYYIYIISSYSGTLYIGVTNNLQRRLFEHKNGLIDGFSKQYKCKRLIYFEEYNKVDQAIAREKQLKNWNRNKKILLIKKLNPDLKDISDDWL
ncbi:MAG: GIY-YIG nuclease family protein [Patescibacteria group bacterium]